MICIKDNIFNDRELTPAAKLFIGFLDKTGETGEGNEYYAYKFNVSVVTINNWLFALEKKGYVKLHYYKKQRNIVILK